MTTKKRNPASDFPYFSRGCEYTDERGTISEEQDGVSLRDQIAMEAMNGMLSQMTADGDVYSPSQQLSDFAEKSDGDWVFQEYAKSRKGYWRRCGNLPESDTRTRYVEISTYEQRLARDAVKQADALIDALHPQPESE